VLAAADVYRFSLGGGVGIEGVSCERGLIRGVVFGEGPDT
jgi:hypothetical protein